MLRARDVREQCKGRVDPMVQKCMEALAEQSTHQFQMIMELAQMVDQMSNIIAANVHIMDKQKTAIEKIEAMRGIDKEDDARYEDVTE